MIVCYHTKILKPWTDDELQEHLSQLPERIQQTILLKRNHLDVQLSVSGNLLLLALMKHFGLNLTSNDLLYSEYRRPYFNACFDFNISHSGNRVICCATMEGKVGVDIELITPIEIAYDDYFTQVEQHNLRTAKNPEAEFFKYWTRKEAVIKTIGTGIYTPLMDIDVSLDTVTYKDEIFHLTPIDIDEDYKGCVAYTVMQEITIKKMSL
jgi:4'-phosphopantetheinyl transferase